MAKDGIEYFRTLGPNARNLIPTTDVGISSLPDQFVALKIRKSIAFNLMVVGTTGVGKTTLLNSLFRIKIPESVPCRYEDVSLKVSSYDMTEGGVNLQVKFIESCGFGDQINKIKSVDNIIQYIDSQFELLLVEESKKHRQLSEFPDPLIHSCIYILQPTGNTLTSLDLVVLQKLQSKVNIILVIGKADTLTTDELRNFKRRIMEDIQEAGIELYFCPVNDAISAKNSDSNERIPFAVISSTDEEIINNQSCRTRKYPWGVVNIDDETHCEFTHLKEMLLRHNLYDLIKKSHDKFYLNYRQERLSDGIPIVDAEMAESLKIQCEKMNLQTEELLEKMKVEYENEVKKLFDSYRTKEQNIEIEYNNAIKDMENKLEMLKSQRNSDNISDSKPVKKEKSKKIWK